MIHIVDDDEPIRDSLSFLLASRGLESQCWPSGEAFLAALPLDNCACIILDVRMGGLSGPEVFGRLRGQDVIAPVIFLTGHADVPIAVQALKDGAFDFLEKPFNDNQIVDIALRAIEQFRVVEANEAARRNLTALLATLTPREEEVMRLMLTGELNKQIADKLNIAIRTVEVHRARILSKMEVRNGLELATMMGAENFRGEG